MFEVIVIFFIMRLLVWFIGFVVVVLNLVDKDVFLVFCLKDCLFFVGLIVFLIVVFDLVFVFLCLGIVFICIFLWYVLEFVKMISIKSVIKFWFM